MVHGDILRGVAMALAEQTALRASQALTAVGIPHIFLKGLPVALTLRAERGFRDVDLLVAWRDFPLARRVLIAEGFREGKGQHTLHSSALGSPLRASPDLDLQAWLGYPLLPRGGMEALLQGARWVKAGDGSIPVPSELDLGCMAALYAVRERFRPEAAPLLEDLQHCIALHGADVLALRARELGLTRYLEVAMDPIYHPWAGRLRYLDARFPRVLSALPALLADGWRGLVSFLVAAALLAFEHVARKFLPRD
ncbi:MAG: nucleotidyltransferase family protein [Myxococcales bacterium]|nr:nucleotidyltransferase family protein [Polyangiaceae bacterium]MDW8251257.1 nucleotidyltransferase family protein [Myxococcales bacterium]